MKLLIVLALFASFLMTLVSSKDQFRPVGSYQADIRGSKHRFARRDVAIDSTILEISTVSAAPGTSVMISTMLIFPSLDGSAVMSSSDIADITIEITQTISPIPALQSQLEPSSMVTGPQSVLTTPTSTSQFSAVNFVPVPISTMLSTSASVTSMGSSTRVTSGASSSSSILASTTLSPVIDGPSNLIPIVAPFQSSSIVTSASIVSVLDASVTSRSFTFVASSPSASIDTSTRLSTTTSLITVTNPPSSLNNQVTSELALSELGFTTPVSTTPATSYPAALTQVALPDTTVTFSGLATTITLTFSQMSTFTRTILPVFTTLSTDYTSDIRPLVAPSSAYIAPVPSIYVVSLSLLSSQNTCAGAQTVTVTQIYTPNTLPAVPLNVLHTTSELPIGGAGVGPTPSALASITGSLAGTPVLGETTNPSVRDISATPCTTLSSSFAVLLISSGELTTHSVTLTSTVPCTTSTIDSSSVFTETTTHSVTQISTIPCTTSATSYSPDQSLEIDTPSVTHTSTVRCTTPSSFAALPTTTVLGNTTVNSTFVHQPSPSLQPQYAGLGGTGAKGGHFAFLLGFVALFVLV